jgi:hypothetical protein
MKCNGRSGRRKSVSVAMPECWHSADALALGKLRFLGCSKSSKLIMEDLGNSLAGLSGQAQFLHA